MPLTKSLDFSGPPCFHLSVRDVDSVGPQVSGPLQSLVLFPMDYSGPQIVCSGPLCSHKGQGYLEEHPANPHPNTILPTLISAGLGQAQTTETQLGAGRCLAAVLGPLRKAARMPRGLA